MDRACRKCGATKVGYKFLVGKPDYEYLIVEIYVYV
jgi:hypothetical protein